MARTRTNEVAGAPSPSNMNVPMGDGQRGMVMTGYSRCCEIPGAPSPSNTSVPTYLTATSPFQRINEIPNAPRP